MGVPAKLALVVAAVVVIIGLSWAFASQGVRDQASPYGTEQPDDPLLDLQVQAAYNDEDIFWRFEWETDSPHYFHDYLVYEGGEWVRYGGEPDGSHDYPINEDRLTFFLDDGSVEGFSEYGGFLTVASFTRNMSPEDIEGEEVEEVFGEGTDDIRKLLPAVLDDPTDWRTRLDDDEIARQQEAGYFLDLWHWRAHRSNPIGFSDDQHVVDHRYSDSGDGPYDTNWDDEVEQPEYMFDPDATGQHAMDWDRVLDLDYGMDDAYFLSDDNAVEFDPDHDWQDGDVIPRRILSDPTDSRGEIFAQGIAQNGVWNLELQRALDTDHPLEDKILQDYGMYDFAPAVHANATGNRWHYIGMPHTVGLGRDDGDIEAVRFDGQTPPWDEIEPTTLTLFYPGVIGWDYITDHTAHTGADDVEEGTPFAVAHDVEDMALYALESEYREEIVSRWLVTGALWVIFIIAGSVAYIRIARRADDAEAATTGAATEE